MKKILYVMLAIFSYAAAYALPVGNPADASLMSEGLIWDNQCADQCYPHKSWCDAWSLRVGFYGDYVFNRHTELHYEPFRDFDVEHLEIYTNAGLIAFNLWNRLDLFGTLGATNINWSTNSASGASHFFLETETDFSWSIGSRATIWECGCFILGAEAQYFQAHSDVRSAFTATSGDYPTGVDLKYTEWQIGAGLAYRYYFIVPYAAIKWSRAYFDHDEAVFGSGPIFLPDVQSKKEWGYAVGFSLIDCERATITVEARFADEKAMHINGQLRF